jgi:hypothetical protein
MRRIHSALLGVLGMAAMAAQPAVLVAADSTTNLHRVVPFTFTMTPADCPLIPVTVSGSGNYDIVTNEQTAADGTTRLVINSLAKGTAIDVLGNTYHFNYHQHANRTIPPSGYPRQEFTNDHFNLLGSGPDGGLHAGFVVYLTFTAPGQPPIVDFTVNSRGGGNPCDPI